MRVTPVPSKMREILTALRTSAKQARAKVEQQRLLADEADKAVLNHEYAIISELRLNSCHVFSDDDAYLIFETSRETEILAERRSSAHSDWLRKYREQQGIVIST